MPVKNTHLNRTKKQPYDEYYTTKEQVEYIFENYLPKCCFKDKIIYSFCDGEQSEFVKYIKSHKEELQYKEYIYTWDDYNTHYDLFEYADIIITNPPFSKIIKEIIPIFNRCKKEFFILGSISAMHNYYRLFEDKSVKYIRPLNRKISDVFICPDIGKQNVTCTLYISNIKGVLNLRKPTKFEGNNNYVMCEINENEVVRNYDRLGNVPLDYYKPILVPSTVLCEHNRKCFDILDNRIKYYKYFDNRQRYVRFLVQRKK